MYALLLLNGDWLRVPSGDDLITNVFLLIHLLCHHYVTFFSLFVTPRILFVTRHPPINYGH